MKGPNATMSGAIPSKRAPLHCHRVFRPKSPPPHSPCARTSISFDYSVSLQSGFLLVFSAARGHAVSNRDQHVVEGLPWYRFHERADQPSKAEGNRPAQADGFALDDHTAIDFLEAPIGIETPQETAVILGSLIFLLVLAGA